MPNFHRFLSRRWLLTFGAAAALVFGLAILHPYPRQALFGPTIRGEPWCAWEARVRRDVQWDAYEKSLSTKVMRWLGVEPAAMDANELYDDAELLPVVLQMTDDPDPAVRASILSRFYFYSKLQDKSALPTLRARLADEDMRCRIEATMAIATIDPKEPVVPVLLDMLNDPKSEYRYGAMRAITYIACVSDEAFNVMVRFAKDSDPTIRKEIMGELFRHGKRGVPTLLQGLDDPAFMVRSDAIESLAALGRDAEEAIRVLQQRLTDKNPATRARATEVLIAVDPVRFGHLRAEEK